MSGYAIVQSTRPQTLAYALTDSPVGQLAWIVEKFKEWTNPAAERPEDAVDRDLILTDVIYWHTRTAGSAARIYREDAATWGQMPQRSPVPTAVAVFPGDITLRPLAERDHNLICWTEYQQGATSRPWRYPTSWSATCAPSSAASGDPYGDAGHRPASPPPEELSIGRRIAGATCADVRRALWEERTLLKTFCLRGTVHPLPTANLPMWTDALSVLPSSVPAHPDGSAPTRS